MASRLTTFIDSRRHLPFSWLKNDCIIFASDWVLEKPGKDPMADMRGMPFKESLRQLQAEGGFASAADARIGNRINPFMANVGDVVLIKSGQKQKDTSGYTFGVCVGASIAAPGKNGLEFVPITMAEAAWQV